MADCVIILDPRAFVRGCLECWLSAYFFTIAVGSPDELKDADLASCVVAICGPDSEWIKLPATLPIMLLIDREDTPFIKGIKGCISPQTPLAVALHAMLLVIAGGTYYPAPPIDYPARPIRAKSIRPKLTNKITPREAAVLALVEQGYQNKSIACNLGLSISTVKVHVHSLIRKMGVSNRTEAMLAARNVRHNGNHVEYKTVCSEDA